MGKITEEKLNDLIGQSEKIQPELKETLACLLELKQLRAEKRAYQDLKEQLAHWQKIAANSQFFI